MKVAKLVIYTVIMMSMLFLSACGGKASTPGATEASKPVQTEPTTPPASEPEKQEIVYWSMWNEGESQVTILQQLMDDYTAAHPNITFKVTWAGREVITKMQTAMSAGQKVDLIDMESPSARGVLIKNGLTLNLDKYVNENAYEENVPFKSIFVPGLLDLISAPDGSVQFIPYSVLPQAFVYDKRQIEKYKLSVPPATWDEFLALLASVKEQGGQALTQEAGDPYSNAMYYWQIIERLLGVGAFFKATTDKTGASWDDPAFLKAAQMERELWDKGYIPEGAAGFVYPAGQQLIATGEAVFILSASHLPNELATSVDPDFQWGMFPFPAIAGGKGKITDSEAYMCGWLIMKDAVHPDAAMDFIKFAMTKESAQRYSQTTVNVSTRLDVDPPKEVMDVWQSFKKTTLMYKPSDGLNQEYPDYFNDVFLRLHDQMFIGKITPEEYITQIKAATVDWWKTHQQ